MYSFSDDLLGSFSYSLLDDATRPQTPPNTDDSLTRDAHSKERRPAPVTPKRRGNAIPRPPNAFMLYRSDLLKSGKLPEGVERRQQNISRLAGECWNMMPAEEKEQWFDKARDALDAHKLQYPEYRFSPRKSPKKSREHPGPADSEDKDHIRGLRERWMGLIGPAVPPSRPRRHKSRTVHRVREQSVAPSTRCRRSVSNAASPASSSSASCASPAVPCPPLTPPMLDRMAASDPFATVSPTPLRSRRGTRPMKLQERAMSLMGDASMDEEPVSQTPILRVGIG